MIAPASLKPRRARALLVPARPTPGHDCPGLIEARSVREPKAYFYRATPGHDCPGLIEARSRPTWRLLVVPRHSGA